MPDEIRITYNGKRALTTALFAERYGMTIATARKTISRLGIEPLPKELDGRTKLWPSVEITKAMGKRPGKGANLRGHK